MMFFWMLYLVFLDRFGLAQTPTNRHSTNILLKAKYPISTPGVVFFGPICTRQGLADAPEKSEATGGGRFFGEENGSCWEFF